MAQPSALSPVKHLKTCLCIGSVQREEYLLRSREAQQILTEQSGVPSADISAFGIGDSRISVLCCLSIRPEYNAMLKPRNLTCGRRGAQFSIGFSCWAGTTPEGLIPTSYSRGILASHQYSIFATSNRRYSSRRPGLSLSSCIDCIDFSGEVQGLHQPCHTCLIQSC